MPKGTVSRIIRGQFGFIKQDDGGEDVYFRLNWVKDAPPSGVAVGLRVEYEVRETPRGLQTRWVRAITEERTAPRPERVRAPVIAGYRFLNPYNFVRPLPVTDRGDPLLGRCVPPPHDRYLGLTGRITCELEAVTPLFTADSEGVVKEEDDHYRFQFFHYGGKPAIPATSLRGSIRSVFEAVTNSCFSVFAGHRRLSQHFDSRKAPELVPARVEKGEDGWKLRLLTGTTPLQIGRTPSGRQYAAWLYQYWPMRPSGTLRQQPPMNRRVYEFQARRRKGHEVKLDGLSHGDECYALLEDVQHPFPRIRLWDVVAVSRDRAVLERRKQPGQRVEPGWLCITNQNIEPKHSERFFFRSQENQSGPLTIDLRRPMRDAYEDLIRDYYDRHEDEVDKRKKPHLPISAKDPGFSRFIYTEDEQALNGGELVYAYLSGSPNRPEVEFIVPVSVPRVGYDKTIGDLLTGLEKCDCIAHLCPACRTFGWVWGTGDPREKTPKPEVRTAYAGRVHFSHARRTRNEGTFNATLAILSSPKPTTVRFYLMSQDGRAQDGLDDDQVNYDAPGQVLRGRKVYHHHGDQLNEREYSRAGDIRDDQNRSVKGVQNPGSKFMFEVSFENLAPIELGALLWALEMEGWHHRFGLAKPLGFGSAVVTVTDLEVLDTEARYTADEAGWIPSMSHKGNWVTAFKNAMVERYGAPFDELSNIQDLRALLAKSPDLPVHYPRTDEEPLPEGKNFEWFMGNKRAGRHAGPRYALRSAPDAEQGLPLLDKFGRVVK